MTNQVRTIYAVQEIAFDEDEYPYSPPLVHVASREIAEQVIDGLAGKPTAQWSDGRIPRGTWCADGFTIKAIEVYR